MTERLFNLKWGKNLVNSAHKILSKAFGILGIGLNLNFLLMMLGKDVKLDLKIGIKLKLNILFLKIGADTTIGSLIKKPSIVYIKQ